MREWCRQVQKVAIGYSHTCTVCTDSMTPPTGGSDGWRNVSGRTGSVFLRTGSILRGASERPRWGAFVR